MNEQGYITIEVRAKNGEVVDTVPRHKKFTSQDLKKYYRGNRYSVQEEENRYFIVVDDFQSNPDTACFELDMSVTRASFISSVRDALGREPTQRELYGIWDSFTEELEFVVAEEVSNRYEERLLGVIGTVAGASK